MADDLMLGDSGLSKLEREMIAVAVSSVNHCHYCLTAHGAAVRQRGKSPEIGELIAQNYRAANLAPRQKAMLAFAVRLTEAARQDRGGGPRGAAPGRVQRPRHLGHRRRRRFYNMSNRLAAATDMRPNREYHYMVREPAEPESGKPAASEHAAKSPAALPSRPAAQRGRGRAR